MCWALVDWGLAHAGARRPEELSRTTRVYGKKVDYSLAQPGDAVAFEKVRLAGGLRIDDHVAIVSAIEGNRVQVIHQNAGATPDQRRRVRQDWLDVSGYSGTITFWRPQPR